MTLEVPLADQQHRKRPVLLTWLCVLSFVYAAFMLISGILNAFTDMPKWGLEYSKSSYEKKKEKMGPEAVAKDPLFTMTQEEGIAAQEHALLMAKPKGYTTIAVSLCGICGVWLMWKLRKTGFWLYVLASIGGLVIQFVFVGSHGLLTSVSSIFSIIVTMTFIVLYAIQLKYMR